MTAEKLKQIRDDSGLSQTAFGLRIHASQKQITSWENGDYEIPEWAEANIQREFLTKHGPLINIVGYVSAGETDVEYDDAGLPVGGSIGEPIERPAKVKDPRAYALRIKGDSMFPAYRDGDTIIIDPSKPVYNKDDAVVRVGGKSYFKIFWQLGDEIVLRSFNEEHPEIRCKPRDVKFTHKVVSVDLK